jgi:hypothetical protein
LPGKKNNFNFSNSFFCSSFSELVLKLLQPRARALGDGFAIAQGIPDALEKFNLVFWVWGRNDSHMSNLGLVSVSRSVSRDVMWCEVWCDVNRDAKK